MTATTKKTKDPMLEGHVFTYDRDKTPYHYLSDPTTGLRPEQTKPPNGFVVTHLRDGIDNRILPPMKVWYQGFWLMEWSDGLGPEPDPSGVDRWATWVVPGEGTPGNYMWRLYELPRDIANQAKPKHPTEWPKKHKEKRGWLGSSKDDGDSLFGGKSKSTTYLPLGLRIRCVGCGHWFKHDDLPVHVQNCCPSAQGHADWAIMCAPECGCETLDQVSTVKEGFPKPVTSHKDEKEGEEVAAKP